MPKKRKPTKENFNSDPSIEYILSSKMIKFYLRDRSKLKVSKYSGLSYPTVVKLAEGIPCTERIMKEISGYLVKNSLVFLNTETYHC